MWESDPEHLQRPVADRTWRDPSNPNNYAFIGDDVLVVVVDGKMIRMRKDKP